MANSFPFRLLFPTLAALYFAQGLPGGLIAHAMPVMLRESGVSLSAIGALKLLALPWLLKVLWAPWVDRDPSNRWRWVVAMQLASAFCLLFMALLYQFSIAVLLPILLILLCLNMFSATQDIATDGIAASSADKDKLGIVNTLQVAGYKVGMLVGGGGLLWLAQYVELSTAFSFYALLLVLLLVPLWRVRHRLQVRSAVTMKSEYGTDAWLRVFRGFFNQQNIGAWMWLLLCYKLSDSLGSAMLKPMLVDLGYDKGLLAALTFQSTLAGLAGAAMGGWLYLKAGAKNMLVVACLAQVVSVSAFGIIPELNWFQIQCLVAVEQLFDGVSTVVLFAWMMRWCRAGREGSDYTLQASIQIVLAGLLGALSGWVADTTSYGFVYALCAGLGVFSVLTVLHFLSRVRQDSEPRRIV